MLVETSPAKSLVVQPAAILPLKPDPDFVSTTASVFSFKSEPLDDSADMTASTTTSSGQPGATPATASANGAGSDANGSTTANSAHVGDSFPWDCEQFPDSATKFTPIKLEVNTDSFESLVGVNSATSAGCTTSTTSSTSSSSDFAELKPMPFDFGTTSLTSTLDPVLNPGNNNNTKGLADLNVVPAPTARKSSAATMDSTGGTSSSASTASSDVTSSGPSPSPPSGFTKLETLDFSASQDAFDDLASIVGISMGADSTVPNMDGDLDLDAWIENTAQNIKPLVPDGTLDSVILPANSLNQQRQNLVALTNATHSYLQMSQSSSSTLQSLLQGNLTPHPPALATKVTQLQRRDENGNHTNGVTTVLSQNPPPYSILQTRLQHGAMAAAAAAALSASNAASNIVKVDSTFDLMKLSAAATSVNSSVMDTSPSLYSTSSYSSLDTMPHSTQHSPLNHVVSTSADQNLHRRLGELSGLAKMKAKHSKIRQKLGLGSSATAGILSGLAGMGGMGGEQGKKMMHHCSICNRGFLNKSNIKVHLRTHTGEKPFKCEHCSKAFRQKAHLLKHMSIHKRISRD